MRKLNQQIIFLIGMMLTAPLGCRQGLVTSPSGEETEQEPDEDSPVPFITTTIVDESLSLTAANITAVVKVSGCVSNFSSTFSVPSTEVQRLYLYDRNCVAEVLSLQFNNETYYPVGNFGYTAGSQTLFTASSGSQAYLTTNQQISSVVSTAGEYFTVSVTFKAVGPGITAVPGVDIFRLEGTGSFNEGSSMQFTIFRVTKRATANVVLNWTVTGCNVTSGDLSAISGSQTFTPTDTQKTVTLNVINDGSNEKNETATFSLVAQSTYYQYGTFVATLIDSSGNSSGKGPCK